MKVGREGAVGRWCCVCSRRRARAGKWIRHGGRCRRRRCASAAGRASAGGGRRPIQLGRGHGQRHAVRRIRPCRRCHIDEQAADPAAAAAAARLAECGSWDHPGRRRDRVPARPSRPRRRCCLGRVEGLGQPRLNVGLGRAACRSGSCASSAPSSSRGRVAAVRKGRQRARVCAAAAGGVLVVPVGLRAVVASCARVALVPRRRRRFERVGTRAGLGERLWSSVTRGRRRHGAAECVALAPQNVLVPQKVGHILSLFANWSKPKQSKGGIVPGAGAGSHESTPTTAYTVRGRKGPYRCRQRVCHPR